MTDRPLTVEAHIGLVYSIARRYARSCTHLSLEDLIQEGVCGLMVALERFDATRGVQFSTYATHWIRHRVQRAVCNQERTIRIPVHRVETLHRAGELKPERVASFDAPLREDGPSIAEVMPSEQESAEDVVERRQREELARALLDVLTERERSIIQARFWGEATLEEVGSSLPRAVTRERVRQLELMALGKMRRCM